MRLNYILSSLSILLLGFGLMVFLPVFVALYYHESNAVMPFVYAGLISVLLSFVFNKFAGGRQNFNDLRKKEGLFIVALAWVVVSLIAGIPFLLSGINPVDAIFEGIASMTTTGATVTNEMMFSKTLYFWCSFSSWLGGMGVIVLFIAILPQFAVAGRQMFFAEVPGPPEDKITPRIKQTAAGLWGIYFVLTAIELLMLKFNGMNWFESACNSLSTISASGFSYHQISDVGAFNTRFLWIGTIFMFLAGVNFTLLYKIFIQKHFKSLFRSTEFMTYIYLIIFVSLFVTLTLIFRSGYDVVTSIRSALYQVISIITSTGATLSDMNNWPRASQILIFLLMLVGGSAGSASGGLKVVRVVIVFKYLRNEIEKILHPNIVSQIKLGKAVVSDEILRQILAFVIFYFLILIGSSIIVCAIENNITIGIMGSAYSLGNINPVFIYQGHGTINDLSPFTKLIFAFNMIVGRLEIIPFVAMLHKDFWKFNLKRSNNE
ncbi:MAG: TrkH family potassium uptake protein [Candidatus Gastranaerophilales bacterium]|nr:TrkH family potassium uptake protein [Candidatus Gastranaerophilales bacterium]